jgi:hypothetical protein
VGRPDETLGRKAKITVEIARVGAATARSETFADVPYMVAHLPLLLMARGVSAAGLVIVTMTRTDSTGTAVRFKMFHPAGERAITAKTGRIVAASPAADRHERG